MSNFKYYDTFQIKKFNPLTRVVAKRQNKKYYKHQDKIYGHLLNINGFPLDNIQKKVVFSEDKYTMVIAAAGSGKTTTMIGKIKYLIKAKKIKPRDILAISFTNESVNSLKKSLENNDIHDVSVLTFHKLALSFIDNPKILKEDYLQFIIREYIYCSCYDNKKNLFCKAFKEDDYDCLLTNIDKYVKILTKIINLCHTNNYCINDFMKIKSKITKKIFYKRISLLSFLYIVMDIYYLYEEEKNSTNSLDFDDMIIKAIANVKKYNLAYKYIIVDEYQDTSLIRVKLLQEIIKNTNARLLVVGDDYQSIYRFNGCDLNIFLNFKKYFPNPKIIKLQNTYRNSQELISISQRFILKNPCQIRKRIYSNKRINNPVKIVYYNESNQATTLKKLINYLKKKNWQYLILGRNNFDLDNIVDEKYNYLTVHKSKGLEADNVIIINLENNIYGFPNQIKATAIEKLLFSTKTSLPYDEERRLFYVALTRTKNYVFLFVNQNNPSYFIKELISNNYLEVINKQL